MQKRFLKDDCGCGGSVLGRRFTVYSFSGPDSSLVTATKRVHMKVDKVSTLEGCFWCSRPSLSAYFAVRVSIMEASNTYLFVIIFSIVIPKPGTYPDKSFGGMIVAASNCGDSMLSSPKFVAAQILRNRRMITRLQSYATCKLQYQLHRTQTRWVTSVRASSWKGTNLLSSLGIGLLITSESLHLCFHVRNPFIVAMYETVLFQAPS